jgi:hypothetical protein
LSNKNQNVSFQSNGRLHVLGVAAEIDPAIGRKLKRGFILVFSVFFTTYSNLGLEWYVPLLRMVKSVLSKLIV